MISTQRASKRHRDRLRGHDVWLSFDQASASDPLARGFGALQRFNEYAFHPGSGVSRYAPHEADIVTSAAEILTYVREGALIYKDGTGRADILRAGDFRYTRVSRGLLPLERNALRTRSAQAFQIWLQASEPEENTGVEQKRFSTAERRGVLREVASADGRNGSLYLRQDASVFSVVLERGQTIVHELGDGRMAWLQVLNGHILLEDTSLGSGDAVGVTDEPSVSFRAEEASEIMLIDLKKMNPDASCEQRLK